MKRAQMKAGLIVRRSGNPRTEVGRARKAQTFIVTEIHGDFRRAGHSRALLRSRNGDNAAFWVSCPTGWEVVPYEFEP